ncbi:hypothetical protein Tco_1458122 [Tanacetum coccineum]
MLYYRLDFPLFSFPKSCSTYSMVFVRDIYGDHVISCVGTVGIKHRHDIVRDTLVDIYLWSGISASKEVDIGLDGGRDKPLRPADMLLYSWDERLDVCVELIGSSPLTQTGMVDFLLGRAAIEVAQQLEKDVVSLLKRIRKFLLIKDIGARNVIYIFSRINFAIAREIETHILSRLPTNFLQIQ